MHAVGHSLTHRGPPAPRTRPRWQPYTPLPSSSARLSSTGGGQTPAQYLLTPQSNVSVSPLNTIPPPPLSSNHAEHPVTHRISPCQNAHAHAKDICLREAQKAKYACSLVDQTVRILNEIWRASDIPPVFTSSYRCSSVNSTIGAEGTRTTQASAANVEKTLVASCRLRNNQLPSPVSPSSMTISPPSPHAPISNGSTVSRQQLQQQHCQSIPQLSSSGPSAKPAASCNKATSAANDAIPLRVFVHEVLRRSRTSGVVLQTALCYIEAVRSKIPDLVSRERKGLGSRGEVDGSHRIIKEDPSAHTGFDIDRLLNHPERRGAAAATTAVPRIHATTSTTTGFKHKQPSPPLLPLPPLPSPLLCPRRTFLAALVLASKFNQDKCYSNRAWAKLSGLAPREIGRCERALGEALEWRLWVGKPVLPSISPSPISSSSSSPNAPLFEAGASNTARLLLLLSNAPKATATGLQGKREMVRSQSVPDISTDPEMAMIMASTMMPHGPAAVSTASSATPCVTQRPLRTTVSLDSASFENSGNASNPMTYGYNGTGIAAGSVPSNRIWNADGSVPLPADNARNALGIVAPASTSAAAAAVNPSSGATAVVAGLRRAMSYPQVIMPSMLTTSAPGQGDVSMMDSLLDGWLVGQQQHGQHDLVSACANSSSADASCTMPSSQGLSNFTLRPPFSSSSFLLPRSGGSGSTSSSSTPSLSFSPASTESSGGDQTIQMSSFIDLPLQCGGGSGAATTGFGITLSASATVVPSTTTASQSSWISSSLSKKIATSSLSMPPAPTTADPMHVVHTTGSPLVPIDPRRAARHDNGSGSGSGVGVGVGVGGGYGCPFIDASHAIQASIHSKRCDSATATFTAIEPRATETTMAASGYTPWVPIVG